MPPLPAVPNTIKIAVHNTNEDASSLNIFYAGYSGSPPTSGQLGDFFSYISGDLAAIYNDGGVDTLVNNYVELTDLSSDVGAVYSGSMSLVPTLTGDVISANNAVCVSHEIARRYRGGHPRTYLMLGSATVLGGSTLKDWQASFVTNVQNDMNTFRTRLGTYGVDFISTGMKNVSYFSGGALRVSPVVDSVVSCIARTRVCSQRRRLGKVGG